MRFKRFNIAKNEEQWMKPVGGLWGSPVDSQYSWKKWCEDNDFKSYAENEHFFFRLACPCNWSIVRSREEWEKYPKQSPLLGLGHAAIDYELMAKEGVGDGFPIYAIVTEFEDREEFDFCFLGYDCDSVLVLNDSILIENYDAKFTENPITLMDLLPVKPFKVIRDNIQVSCLLRSPDDKFYIYYEEPSVHYGFKTLVACVRIGKIDEGTIQNILEYQNIGGQVTLDEFHKLTKEEQQDIMDYLEEFTAYEEITVNGKRFIIIHAGFINFSPEKKLEDYELYELIFKTPDYEKVYFENKYLVTGHLPTRAIHGAKPDEIYIANNHIAIDCASGYGGKVGCIRLDDFKTFYSQTSKIYM